MRKLLTLTLLLLADVLCAQAAALVIQPTAGITPSYQGIVTTYPTTAGNLDIEGMVIEVANGASIASLGLSLTVDGPTTMQAVLSAPEMKPQPTGYVPGEWQVANLANMPFTVSPTSGTLLDDTTHYFHLTATGWGPQGLEMVDFAFVIVVGSPSGQGVQQSYPATPATVSMTITPTSNGQPISGSVDVTVGASLASLGLSVFADNGAWANIGVQTSISNVGSTGIVAAEFCAYAHHNVTLPASTPSGVLDTVGTHQFDVLAWGLIIGLISQGGYLHWIHDVMALRVTFTVNVLPDPTIELADSQGSIAPDAIASGDRDFGVHDAAALPTAWANIEISNSGTGDLQISGWNFATPAQGAGAAAYGFDDSGLTTTVPQGAGCHLKFRLEGGGIGVHSVWIELWHSDLGVANPFRFELKGEVTVAPLIGVSDSGGAIAPGAAATGARDFGQVDVAAMPTAPLTITVSNNGSGDLDVGTPMLSGLNPPDFLLLLSGFTNVVAPGSSTSFGVVFEASWIGVKSATISFTHTDTTVASPFTFGVAGVAVSANVPVITISSLPGGMDGAAYGPEQVAAVGGNGPLVFRVASGSLPAGMQLSAAGQVSGTPGAIGVFGFTVEVEDSFGAASMQPLSIEIAFDPLTQDGGGTGGGGSCAAAAGGALAWASLLMLTLAIARRSRRRDSAS